MSDLLPLRSRTSVVNVVFNIIILAPSTTSTNAPWRISTVPIIRLVWRIQIIIQIMFSSINIKRFRLVISHPPILTATTSRTTHTIPIPSSSATSVA